MTKKNTAALLCIDIGNTTIALCLYKNSAMSRPLSILKIPASPVRTAAEYQKIISGFLTQNRIENRVIDTIIGSVVPALTIRLKNAARKLTMREPLIVSNSLKTDLTFRIPDPSSTGSDRIANAVAAFHCLKTPGIIVDLGSATTLTVVGKHGAYLGGAILPGIETMLKSLQSGTARLKTGTLSPDTNALGSDTDSAISSGIIIGTAGAVKEIASQISKETGLKFQIVLTGGNAEKIHRHLKVRHSIVPNLTFEGLRIIYTKNR
ncbi:MAG: type III pantothenate kinase [Dissulfurispiraceae bacterium]|jgi:type III pantothenate kinase|nr:type III pantothenate kinase [Dissulfurispiraceae bacterium]